MRIRHCFLTLVTLFALSGCASDRSDGPQAWDVQPTQVEQNQAKLDHAITS